jgi:hypothetical protein
MHRRLVICIALALCLAIPGEAAAQGGPPAVSVIHSETIRVGPYPVTVGFSEWPVHAERSLDIIFVPAGGIAGKTGTVTLIGPSGGAETLRLVRHPRMRAAWGLDIIALPEQGRWTLRLQLDGPEGSGAGQLPVTLLERPGPPAIIGWIPALLVTGCLIALLGVAWRRGRPARQRETWSWT